MFPLRNYFIIHYPHYKKWFSRTSGELNVCSFKIISSLSAFVCHVILVTACTATLGVRVGMSERQKESWILCLGSFPEVKQCMKMVSLLRKVYKNIL